MILGSSESYGSSFDLQQINNADKEAQLAAVRQSHQAIGLIENPDKDVQMAAVEHSYYAIKFIKDPDIDVVKVYYKILMDKN